MSDKKELKLNEITTILTDVAGTTTSLKFVEETLFPYVVKNGEEFLKNNWDDENLKNIISEFNEKDLDATKTSNLLKQFTKEKSKNQAFKKLQALIIEQGYVKGDFKGHVFSDVNDFLKNVAQKKVAVYSSGDINSQKLLFKHSEHGDISTFISNYFDLSVGNKNESESYIKISKELNEEPAHILFLTDDIEEAKAAQEAKLVTALVVRDGDAPAECEIPVIKSFSDVSFADVCKRKLGDVVEEPPKKLAKTDENKEADEISEKKEENSMDVDEVKTQDKEKTEEVDVKTEEKMETESAKTEENKPEEQKTQEKEVMTLSKSFTENHSQTTITIAANEKKTDDEIKEKISSEENEDIPSKVTENGENKEEESEADKEVVKSDDVEEVKKTVEETKVEEEVVQKNDEENKESKDEVEESKENIEKKSDNEVCDKKEIENGKTEDVVVNNEKVDENVENENKPEAVEKKEKIENSEKEVKIENGDKDKKIENTEMENAEKENKIDLANGLENGKTNGDNTKETEKSEEILDIKTKTAEEKIEAAPVSVEA